MFHTLFIRRTQQLISATACVIGLLLFTPGKQFAQSADSLLFPHTKLPSSEPGVVLQYLAAQFPQLATGEIQLHQSFESWGKASRHIAFDMMYRGFPVYRSCVKVNMDLDARIFSVKIEHPDLGLLQDYDPAEEVLQWRKKNLQAMAGRYWPADRSIRSSRFVVYMQDDKPLLAAECNAWSPTYDETLVLNADGDLLASYDQTRHVNIDTVIHGKIFNPDPLTVLGLTYGGLYKDMSDVNSAWMNAAYTQADIPATYSTGTSTFYLENPLLKMDDLEAPVAPAATSAVPDFFFDRSQSGFEDVNVYYHILNFHQYIGALGYGSLMNLQLTADAHAQFGADNSVFNRNGGSPTILFGTGGVDDGEDADVIIHEYSHGLSWSANNNSSFTTERGALDEGLADYFATSYSRNINPFHWDSLFTWDGHNEYWPGRTASTPNTYPTSGSIYKTGEVWNAAMSAIWADIGAIETDNLMLEALHFFTDQTTLPEAAKYILQADTILYGGVHTTAICNRFKSKNILDANCKPAGLTTFQEARGASIRNTVGFANGDSEAMLSFPNEASGQLELFSITGARVFCRQFRRERELRISPIGLPPGMYVVRVHTADSQDQFRLMRHSGK